MIILSVLVIHNNTVNPLFTDFRYNDKTRYNDNLNETCTSLKMRQISRDIQKYNILYLLCFNKKKTLTKYTIG